jgi:hypothetical protein
MPLFGVAFSVAMPVAALFVRGFPAGGGCAQVRRSSRLASGPQSAARRAGWSRFIVSTAHFCSEVVNGSHPPRVNHIGTGTFVRCSQPRDARLSNPANSKRIIARSCQRRVHQAEPVARAAAWRIPRHASELPPIPAAHTAPQGQEGAEDLSLVPGVVTSARGAATSSAAHRHRIVAGAGGYDPPRSCLLPPSSRHEIRQPVGCCGSLLWCTHPSRSPLAAISPPRQQPSRA